MTMRGHIVGVVSDTHGLLRPEALAALQGSDRIVHAGDVGDDAILERLREIAPVAAVRGNNDRGAWASRLPQTHRLEVAGARIFVIHDLAELAVDPVAIGIDIVVCGHSHRPVIERRGSVLYVNPGSAGPRRFRLPISVARLSIADGEVEAELVSLAAVEGFERVRAEREIRGMRGRPDRQA
jgi:putative phosphoesterase